MQHEASAIGAPATPRRTKVTGRRGIYYRKTPKGRKYEVTFTDTTGRQRWKTIPGTDNLKDAEAALEELRSKLRRGERVAPARLTFAETVELWRPTLAGLRPRTRDAYDSSLRVHLLPRFGCMRLADIGLDHVAAFIDELRRDGYAGWTIHARLVVLSRVFAYAVRRGIVAANPVRALERGERPSVGRAEMRILDRHEIHRMLDAATPGRRALLATATFTGVRLGELLGLVWADIDLNAGRVRIRRQLDRVTRERVEPKTPQATRDVILMPALGRLLREHLLASPHAGDGDFVFASGHGGGLDQTVARAALARALNTAGLDPPDKPNLRFHDLRHTFASLLVAQGSNVVFISRQLGHASPDITLKVYAHLFDAAEHAERATQALEHGFAAALDGKNLENNARNGRQPDATHDPPKVALLSQTATRRNP
jgi:integrase